MSSHPIDIHCGVEAIHGELVDLEVASYSSGIITRKTYFKRMAGLGYQQAEALELARNWDDE